MIGGRRRVSPLRAIARREPQRRTSLSNLKRAAAFRWPAPQGAILMTPTVSTQSGLFVQLEPLLVHRAVLITVSKLEGDQLQVNICPRQLKDGENQALTTPLCVTGTAAELDADLVPQISSFVATWLRSKRKSQKRRRQRGRRPRRSRKSSAPAERKPSTARQRHLRHRRSPSPSRHRH